MNQKAFFNAMAEKWDTICNHDSNKIKYILGLLNIQRGAKILDVGSGTGVLIPFLAPQVGEQGEIVAVDVSEKMIEVAQRKYPFHHVTFICDDILKADLPKEKFDFVICYSVFPHFEDKQLTVNRLATLLKSEGKCMICHSQSREAINNLHKNASEAVAGDNLPEMKVIKEYFNKAQLKPILEIDDDHMFVVIGQK